MFPPFPPPPPPPLPPAAAMMGSEKETDSVESERSVESPEGYENCVVESVVTSGMGWNTSHAAGGSAGASSGAGAGGAGVVAAPPVPSVAAADVEMSGSAKVRVSRSGVFARAFFHQESKCLAEVTSLGIRWS